MERQLTQSLCAEVTCVAASQVLRQGRLDWGRVAAAELTGVLTAKILRDASGKKRLVDIQLLAPGPVVLVRKKAPLSNLALSSAALHTLTADLVGVLHRAHGPEREVADAPATAAAPAAALPATQATPAPPAVPTEAAAVPAVATPAPASPPVAEGVPAEAESPVGDRPEPSFLEVQVSLAFFNREYTYAAAPGSTPVLRSTFVPLAAQPSLLVAVFPFRASSGVFESFGVEAGVGISVGMLLQRENDTSGTTFPAVSLVANAALLARLRLGPAVRLAPLWGWQMMNFDVQKAADGTVLTGQPGVHWRALRAGLALDVDFNAWCALFLELSYLDPYSAGPLTRSPYFTSSSAALSFDSAVGLSFRVSPSLQVRLGVALTLYALSFGSGSGPANITGVTDQLVGFVLGFRYSD